MPNINPYNFVPLENGQERKLLEEVPKHHRLNEDHYSGYLDLLIVALTPVVIPSRLSGEIQEEPHIYNTKKGRQEGIKRTFSRFHHNGSVPTIPGSSIKGMIRSVYEALTSSCMVLFAETYQGRTYPAPEYRNEKCNPQDGLCEGCSLFGTLYGEELHLQGKVRFQDAIGNAGSLEKGNWKLKELSSPKPERHLPFYAKDGSRASSGPKGRKFYYHHDPKEVVKQGYTTQSRHDHRNVKILERLKAGAQLKGRVDFQNLTRKQMGYFLYSIELKYEIQENNMPMFLWGHKIGMGKPLGLGSLIVTVTNGDIQQGDARYRQFDSAPSKNIFDQIDCFRKEVKEIPAGFEELFQLIKYKGNTIEYPGYQWFNDRRNRSKKLNDDGSY